MRIAICDDNEKYINDKLKPLTVRAAAEANLSAEIITFTDGNLLVKAFEQGNGFDIVMLDIDMPGINGKAAAERLRLLDSGFFLLFITSFRAEIFNTIPYKRLYRERQRRPRNIRGDKARADRLFRAQA